MRPANEILIRVHRAWDGWQSAEVRVDDLSTVHWFQPPGAPHALIHAMVPCTALATGAIPHACDAASAPHALRVCILKRHTLTTIYAELVRRAERRTGCPEPRLARGRMRAPSVA